MDKLNKKSSMPVSIAVVEETISGQAESYIIITIIGGECLGQTGVGCGMLDAAADLASKVGPGHDLTLMALGSFQIESEPLPPLVEALMDKKTAQYFEEIL